MSHRTVAMILLGALALTVGGRPEFPGPGGVAGAEPPKEPGQREAIKEPRPEKPPPPDEPPPADGGPRAYYYTTDEAIRFFQARVEKNPTDHISYRYLGESHERKARETGDLAAFARAEAALRKSLKLVPDYPRAQASLAAVLCSRHKFAEGLEIARKVVEKEPKNVDALASMGDALLELGRYPEAESTYQELYRRAPLPEVLARQANLAELRGNPEEGIALMRRALDEVQKTRTPREAAWYLGRLGDISFNLGRIEEAGARFEAVPKGCDAYHDATAGLGRVRAAQGRYTEAIELYKRAVAIGPDLHMLAALGDLYARTGDTEMAEAQYRQLEEVAATQVEHSRELSYFYSDHDRKLEQALELARKEFAARQDVYGHDALAWALYKNGRFEEAARSIAEALKVGTKDARLFYHAGLIYGRLGDAAKARDYLARALALNPHFSLLEAEKARAALAALDRNPSRPDSRK